jgi:hypothetical protein
MVTSSGAEVDRSGHPATVLPDFAVLPEYVTDL